MSVDSPLLPVERCDATEPIGIIARKLNAWQPSAVITYPSLLRQLAGEQAAGRLSIRPSAILCSAEALTAETRGRLRGVWGCEPFDVYGTSETGALAAECPAHRLHLFDDLVIAEVVDDRNRPVPEGEVGDRVLVTALFLRTQPLIRYELDDQVRVRAGRCTCGRPFALFGAIEGRDNDVLQVPGRAGGTVPVNPVLLLTLLDPLPVYAYQIWEEAGGLRILLVRPPRDLDLAQVSDDIQRALDHKGASPRCVIVEAADEVVRTATGKAPCIRRLRAPEPHPTLP